MQSGGRQSGDGAGIFGVDIITLAVWVLVCLVFVGYPVWRILERVGYDFGPRVLWLAGFALVPGLALWFFAFAHWPVSDAAGKRPLAG
jgi:hypothetical protein